MEVGCGGGWWNGGEGGEDDDEGDDGEKWLMPFPACGGCIGIGDEERFMARPKGGRIENICSSDFCGP